VWPQKARVKKDVNQRPRNGCDNSSMAFCGRTLFHSLAVFVDIASFFATAYS